MRRQPEHGAHRAAHPRVRRRLGRPGALVQSAQDQPVGSLETRLQHTPDLQTGMAAVAWPDDPAAHQRVEEVRPGAAVDRSQPARGASDFVHDARRRRAVLARPQTLGAAGIGARGQPLSGGDVGLGQIGDPCPSAADDEIVERRQRIGNAVEPFRDLAVVAEGALQPVRAGFRPRASEHRALERAHTGAEGAGLHPAGGERMLEQRQERNRRPAVGRRPGEQAEERAG